MMARIVLTYMQSIVEGQPLQRAVAVCDAAGISRTTFYNHFENMSDLDQRFLGVFAQLVLDSVARPFVGYDDLRNCYWTIVRAQADQAPFFRKVLADPALVRYRYRWFEAVEAFLLDDYRACFTAGPSHQKDFMVTLAIGVVRRYLEWSILRSGSQLAADTDLMLEYLWAGVQMVNQRSQGLWLSTVPDIDRFLSGAPRTEKISS
jgi:AcrR family transcriptional regulator